MFYDFFPIFLILNSSKLSINTLIRQSYFLHQTKLCLTHTFSYNYFASVQTNWGKIRQNVVGSSHRTYLYVLLVCIFNF